jgi:hypothetical protein
MKLVLQTQNKENYAYFNDDYVVGESAPYWKMKGGSTYVIHGLSVKQVQVPGFWEEAYSMIESKSEAACEYIIHDELIDDRDFDVTKHIEEWETAIDMYYNDGKFTAMKISNNRDMGYRRREILEVIEAWDVEKAGTRSNYKATYLMEDGDIVDSLGLTEWFKSMEEVA